jgi:hypothetical protein
MCKNDYNFKDYILHLIDCAFIWILDCHILTLELDMEVFMEVLETLVQSTKLVNKPQRELRLDFNSPVKKHLKRILDCK